jgi:hypothetical protein
MRKGVDVDFGRAEVEGFHHAIALFSGTTEVIMAGRSGHLTGKLGDRVR